MVINVCLMPIWYLRCMAELR